MTHANPVTLLAAAATVPPVALAVAGCGGSGGNNAKASATPPKTTGGKSATLGVADTGLGSVLVDSQGRTLYLFKRDTGTKSSCLAACAAAWPPLRASGRPTLGSRATASKVATTRRSDGTPQVTYNGHPLYRYQGDGKPGDTNGQGITAFGAAWYALSPAGNQVTRQSSSSGGKSGY